MSMFALRVPDAVRKQMESIKINWSEYLRQSILEAIHSDRKRAMIAKLRKLTGKNKPTEAGTAASIIRQIRDHG